MPAGLLLVLWCRRGPAWGDGVGWLRLLVLPLWARVVIFGLRFIVIAGVSCVYLLMLLRKLGEHPTPVAHA